MTKKEAVQILAVLKAAYPASYNGMTKEEATGTVSVWAMQFQDMPADIVMMAIQKLIATNKFPPTVAEVNDKLQTIHWEVYDFIAGRLPTTDAEKAQYQRIYDATKDYTYGRMYEPKIPAMLTFNQQQRIGPGE